MNPSIQALSALLSTYLSNNNDPAQTALVDLFESKEPFTKKVKLFDKIVAEHPQIKEVSEFIFDLLMAYHLEDKQDDERYFDSKEWLDIEDQTLERGTELLNLLLYLTEAKDNQVDVELDDFLNEFLLIDEDEFQDEYKIYEDLITHADLIEEDDSHMISAARQLALNEELKDLFLPILFFFKDPGKADRNMQGMTPAENSLLGALVTFYQTA